MGNGVSVEYVIATVLVLFLGIGIHEYAHCKVAEMAGDPTPRAHGRVTLNLFKHFELMGTIMMVVTSLIGFGIGWGKPAPMNPKLMKNPRWDFFSAVLAGPLSNMIQAVVFALILRLGIASGAFAFQDGGLLGQTLPFFTMFLMLGVFINIALCFFNLFPLGPLDGMWILGSFMPEKQQVLWYQWNRNFGGMVFLGLLLFSQTTGQGIFSILGPITESVSKFLIGF